MKYFMFLLNTIHKCSLYTTTTPQKHWFILILRQMVIICENTIRKKHN